MKFKDIVNKFWSILYPENYSCIFCDDEIIPNQYSTCEKCKQKYKIEGSVCDVCGTPLTSMAKVCLVCKSKHKFVFKKARTPLIYNGEVAHAIQKLKYKNARYIAKPLACFMADTYTQENFECDCIIPVPLHKDKEKERGFNQAKLLSDSLGELISLQVYDDVLVRTKQTPTQTNLNYKQRQSNLTGAFKVQNRAKIKGKTILLVDDVFTTGATSENCAQSLLLAGAKRIYVICAAHTVVDDRK